MLKCCGSLVLIGGAEERRGKMPVLARTVEMNHADNVVVIPTASAYPRDLGDDYYYAFKDLGVRDVCVFDIRSREEAGKREYLERITKADLIFFTGGDQVKLVDIIKHTSLFRLIRKKWMAGATIAGTSAGAAAASNPLIYDGDESGFAKGITKSGEGFGFVRNITIDTHFTERNRIYRLTQYLLSGSSHRGIGIGENTGVIIAPDHTMEITGSGMVTVINTKRATFSNYENVGDSHPLTANGINIGFLHEGAVFNLQYWTVNSERSNFDNLKEVEQYSAGYYR